MTKAGKTWQEKLADNKDLPRVVTITDKMSKRWRTGTLVILAPREEDEIMGKVPGGKLITINQIRETVAQKHIATIGCPLTMGIFGMIEARAAEEVAAESKSGITSYWWTLKSKGELNGKNPGGIEAQAAHLRKEGHTVESGKSKKPPQVKNFKKELVEL